MKQFQLLIILMLLVNVAFSFNAIDFSHKQGVQLGPKSNVVYKRHVSMKSPIKTRLLSQNTVEVMKEPKKYQNLRERWATGLSMGAIGTLWIASGNGLFTLGFLFMSLVALNEYYNMVTAVGVVPAKKTGIVASLMCYVTASMFPNYHEIVMPISSTFLMLWLLVFNKKSASISEISTSLLGMFYVGYLPSFWVRLRAINGAYNAFVVPQPLLQLFPKKWHYFTPGAMVTWWTWVSIVVADVSAYFVGKNYGKHKLSSISSAAGSASPNKTIEGAVGGMISCSLISILGAYVMKWPLWFLTGATYGVLISFIALVGDLTASMMKRDAGFKDSGTLLPGHGGLLDRIDSYMFTAPASYFFIHEILPLVSMIK